jgi:hypothetical protein
MRVGHFIEQRRKAMEKRRREVGTRRQRAGAVVQIVGELNS